MFPQTTVLATGGTVLRDLAHRFGHILNVKDDFGAMGNGSHDDASVIQTAITEVANAGGGIVFFPPGNYILGTGLQIPEVGTGVGVILQGSGSQATTLTPNQTMNVITFEESTSYSSVRDMQLNCGTSGGNGVLIPYYASPNEVVGCTLLNVTILGGSVGLNIGATDCLIQNCYIGEQIAGGISVKSTGANWYIRNKFDSPNSSPAMAFYQGVSQITGVVENHLVQCDFSGNFTEYSVWIDDTAGDAVMVFQSCVFGGGNSPPIPFQTNGEYRWISLNNCEVGASIINNANQGVMNIVGCYPVSGNTITGLTSPTCMITGCFNIS